MHKQKLTLSEALAYLQEQEVLISIQKGQMLYYGMRNEKVVVQSVSARYVLCIEDFIEMFQNEAFYIYEKNNEQVEISKEKDDEYYGWYHK